MQIKLTHAPFVCEKCGKTFNVLHRMGKEGEKVYCFECADTNLKAEAIRMFVEGDPISGRIFSSWGMKLAHEGVEPFASYVDIFEKFVADIDIALVPWIEKIWSVITTKYWDIDAWVDKTLVYRLESFRVYGIR